MVRRIQVGMYMSNSALRTLPSGKFGFARCQMALCVKTQLPAGMVRTTWSGFSSKSSPG
jgi:hypothetical protein